MGDKIFWGVVHGSTRMGCIKKDDGRGCHVPKKVVKREKLVHAVKGIIREEGAKRVWGRGIKHVPKGVDF